MYGQQMRLRRLHFEGFFSYLQVSLNIGGTSLKFSLTEHFSSWHDKFIIVSTLSWQKETISKLPINTCIICFKGSDLNFSKSIIKRLLNLKIYFTWSLTPDFLWCWLQTVANVRLIFEILYSLFGKFRKVDWAWIFIKGLT